MTFGTTTRRLANADDVGPRTRAAIREALTPTLEHIRHNVELLTISLGGPDPEFALAMFVDVISDLPRQCRDLETTLAKSTRGARTSPGPAREVRS